MRAHLHKHNLYFVFCHQPPWHLFNCFPSPAHLHFLSLTELLLSFTILWRNRRDCFSLSLFDTGSACPCILLAASFFLKWSLHTDTGLTLHCWAHSLHTEVRLPTCMHTHLRAQTSTDRDGDVQGKGNAYSCALCRHRQHLAWVILIWYDGRRRSLSRDKESRTMPLCHKGQREWAS